MDKINILLTFVFFICIDSFYLYSMKNYFNHQVMKIQGSKINIKIYSTILCYIFLVTGLYYFIIKEKREVMDAFFLGIFVYGVYETTNLALFDKWDIQTAFIDTIWGGILFSLTTYLVYNVKRVL